jgi:hypothetical protein
MCFSATASFVAGSTLVAAGAAVLPRTRNRAELPYAAIPLLFGLQQLVEGVIWLTFRLDAPILNPASTFAYSLFSHVLWPMYVPFAALAIEPRASRRRWMLAFAAAGSAAGLYLFVNMLRFPIEARAIGGHIEYASPHFYRLLVMAGYLAGTCLSLLFSSRRYVALFGAAALASFLVSYLFYTRWLISVWCFFAAALSLLVLLHFARGRGAIA